MERDFKGVWIPKELWLSKKLTPIEKFFLIEIDSLDNDNGCFASNAHFSELFGLTKGRCTQIIKSLEVKKMVKITLEYEGKQIKKRTIKVFNKLNRGIKNIKSPYLENAEGNNTNINNTNIYKGIQLNEKYSHQMQKDFIDHRIAMKSKMTQRAFDGFINNLNSIRDAGHDVDQAVEEAITRGWKTIKLEWIENEKRERNNKLSDYEQLEVSNRELLRQASKLERTADGSGVSEIVDVATDTLSASGF
jgi:hypothetical protein